MTHKFYPYKGKWTMQRIVKEKIQASGGELPLEDLLGYLHELGYHRGSVRSRLRPLGVEVLDGMARLRG